jgi:RNase P subunit RPR2
MGEKNMERLDELIRILSTPAMRTRHSKAMSTRTCKICGGPALLFRDAASSFEYTVSAICQDCQDKYLYAADRQPN